MSLVTVASSAAIVDATGVEEFLFVASWVWYDFSALVTASSSAVIAALSLSTVVVSLFSAEVTASCWVVIVPS